jgi:hypothetical protein
VPIGEARGATLALTDVKHRLRDWVESHLAVVQWKEGLWTTDPTVLQEQLNEELSRADVVCPLYAKCQGNPLGYIGRVKLEVQSGFPVVRTSVGVQHGPHLPSDYYNSRSSRVHLRLAAALLSRLADKGHFAKSAPSSRRDRSGGYRRADSRARE